MQVKVLFARFPFGASEHPDCTDWMVQTVLKASRDPRISEVLHTRVDDTPITMSRNLVCKQAQAAGADIICMLDSDMRPDLKLPGRKPFWDSSLEFMLNHPGPAVIAAPYCGPPPHENVYVFRWANKESDHPNVDISLEQFSREEAQGRGGIEEVAALPTGLVLIDVRALNAIRPPYFEYEYEDAPFNTRKATTEDVFFTRNLSLAGVPQYVNWDAWAGHHKRKCVGRPATLSVESVRENFRGALLSGRRESERLIEVRPHPRDQAGSWARGRAAIPPINGVAYRPLEVQPDNTDSGG